MGVFSEGGIHCFTVLRRDFKTFRRVRNSLVLGLELVELTHSDNINEDISKSTILYNLLIWILPQVGVGMGEVNSEGRGLRSSIC
jgi:hypothetical protein